jgi:hypothetical protein
MQWRALAVVAGGWGFRSANHANLREYGCSLRYLRAFAGIRGLVMGGRRSCIAQRAVVGVGANLVFAHMARDNRHRATPSAPSPA